MFTKSKKYAEYIKEHNEGSYASHTTYKFPNGYGAIVIHGAFTSELEATVIRWRDDHWSTDYSTPITNDVIGYIGYIDDLDAVLEEIYNL